MSDTLKVWNDNVDVEAITEYEDRQEIDSVTLARLMEEVRNEGEGRPTSYNRMHNRHNRS